MATAKRKIGAFEAIADPSRRKILDLLKTRDRTAGELAKHFRFSWPALSQHLAILKVAGLVRVRREGRFLWYSADPEPLERECAAWVMSYLRFWRKKLRRLKDYLESDRSRRYKGPK